MKKAMVLAVSVLLTLLGGVGYAVAQITPKEDQVEITETVRYGDPTQAYGLTAGISTTLDYHLFWDTNHTFGEVSRTQTDVWFDPDGQIRNWPREQYLNLRDSVSGSMSAHGKWTDLDEAEKGSLSGLELAYYELAQKTAAGEENESQIRLEDYYKYYPIEIELMVENIYYNDWDFERAMEQETYREERDREIRTLYERVTDFFKIPVLPEEYIKIHLRKNEDGNISSWGYSSGGEGERYSLYTHSCVAEDAVYFSIHNRSRNGEIMDTQLIPGGYGLYCLPFVTGDEEKETLAVLCPERLEMVYALPEEEQVFWLRMSEDQQRLILVTGDEETVTIRVIRREDLATMQVLTYPGDREEMEGCNIFWEEDHLMLLCQGELTLFEVEADGTFELKFSVESDPTGELELPLWAGNAVTDWNGEKLAVLMKENIVYGRPDTVYCGADLAVYDHSGLLYCGKLGSSLDTEPGREYNSLEMVTLIDYLPLTIAWNE